MSVQYISPYIVDELVGKLLTHATLTRNREIDLMW